MKKQSLFGVIVTILVFLVIAAFWWSASQINPSVQENNIASKPVVLSQPSSSQPLIVAQSPRPQSQQNSVPTAPKTWHIVATLSGSGQENTAPFTIKGSEWRVDWTETLMHDPASFCEQGGPCTVFVAISLAGQTQAAGDFSMATMNALGTATGTSYEYLGPGSYYLFINPDFSPAWAVTIEDYY